MIILGENKIDINATVTVTGGNALIYDYPRLYNQVADEVALFNDNIVFDFGSAITVTSIAVVNTSADVTIQANTSDSWASPAYSVDLVAIPNSRVRFTIPASAKTYRYWRIKSSGICYVGYLLLGSYVTIPARTYGQMQSIERIDSVSNGVGGVSVAKAGYTRKKLEATVGHATDTELETMRDFYASYGFEPCIVVPYEDEDQTTLKEFNTAFFARAEFDFGARSAYNANSVKITFTETK